MTRKMLVDAEHPEETRVAIVDCYRDNSRLEDLDYSLASKPQLKGNIYLAKVMRVEPSLQAAFVEYGGNRHGFLSFSEIHPDYYRIPVADRPSEEDEEETMEEVSAESADVPDEPEDQSDDDMLVPAPVLADEVQSESAPVAAAEVSTPATGIPVQEAAAAPVPVEAAAVEAAPAPTMEVAPAPEAVPENVSGGSFTLAAPVQGEPDPDVGLITDFGNAAVNPPALDATGAPIEQPPSTPESVGGEESERFVRRQRRPHYKIQEVVKRGQVMLVQVVKEERGNKGAALTSYLSLAGRYCVLMPNTGHGGGVSRKITNHQDRRRMKEILDQLEIPEGMAVILRTAGMEQDPPEIQRDLEYLLRLWNNIREQTLQSTAPALIYEEANLIKRSVRDLHSQEISEILVSGEEGYRKTREFMHAIMPDEVEKIKLYQDPVPLFFRYNVENQIDTLHTPIVQLRSGGYLVINPTEALVSIDVNSGRATRERHIEETAVKTNLEAADEVARQLRLRDLAGLVVIDFIDMEDPRNNAAVERRMKEAMRNDRARLQISRLSAFGLMELSRQRLRPSLTEINFEVCPHCAGVGLVRSVDSAALSVLRVIEEEGIKQRSSEIIVHVATKVALYLLNQKRAALSAIEKRYDMSVLIENDDTLVPPEHKLERSRGRQNNHAATALVDYDKVLATAEKELPPIEHTAHEGEDLPVMQSSASTEVLGEAPAEGERGNRNRRRFGRDRNSGRRDHHRPRPEGAPATEETPKAVIEPSEGNDADFNATPQEIADMHDGHDNQRRRRRGRRGGRRRSGNEGREGSFERRPSFQEGSAPMPATSVPFIPTSIHEIDTTPRHPAEDRRFDTRSAPVPSPHEIVNPPNDKPKGGWWRRLTGQDEQ